MSRRHRVHRPERDREIFKVLKIIKDLKNSEAARKAGISPTTVRNMRKAVSQGGTRYPQHYTLSRLALAGGYEYKLVNANEVE